MFSCREVHQRVAAPIAAPYRLVDLLLDSRRERGVADVCVQLHAERLSDDHRFSLRVVDVGRDNSPSRRHFLTHELRSDVGFDSQLLVVKVLAYSHILHLGGHHTGFCVSHLRDLLARQRHARVVAHGESDIVERGIGEPLASVFGRDADLQSRVGALLNPFLSQPWDALVDVHLHVGVGVDAACVVYHAVDDFHRRSQLDAAHTHLNRVNRAVDIDFFGIRIRIYVDICKFHINKFFVDYYSSRKAVRGLLASAWSDWFPSPAR